MMRAHNTAWVIPIALYIAAPALAQSEPANAAAPGSAAQSAPPASSAQSSSVAPPAATSGEPAAATPTGSETGAGAVGASGQPAATAAPRAPAIFPAESLRLARERWRIEVLRARARQRAALGTAPALQAETEPAPRHGDAGAAIAIGASWDRPWYTDPSYDVFSDKDVASRFGLWAAHDIASLRSDTIAALEVGWATEQAKDNGLLGGALSSELTTHAFYGGVQLRWVPVSWLQPHARLAGGAAVVNMALQTSAPSQRFADRGVSPFGSLGLGCTLRTPTRSFEDRKGKLAQLSLGLMLEGGYTLAAPLDFSAAGPGPGKREIVLTDSKLGRLARSGPYARASIVVRF